MKNIIYSLLLLIPLFTHASFEHDFAKSQVTIIRKAAKGSSEYTRCAVLKALEYITANIETLKTIGCAHKLKPALKNAHATQAFLLDSTIKEKYKNQIDQEMKVMAFVAAVYVCWGIILAQGIHRTIYSDYQYWENASWALLAGTSGGFGLFGAVSSIQALNELINLDQTQQEKLDNVCSIIAELSKLELA